MEDYPERSRFDDDQIAYNGNEEFEQPPEQQFEEFEQQREQQSNHNLDNEGNEFRDSFSHRDSAAGKLFVGGVSWETTEENFSNYFSKYGEIVDSVIMIDKHTGKPRGFGFVTFSDPMVIDSVLEVEHVIDGRVVEVKRTVPRGDVGFKGASKRKKIFVGGIPTSLTDDELGEYFSAYGTIVEHQIMLDHKTGRSRGFGFVTFENEDALDKIFSDGKVHELGGKQVEIKKAEPKRGGGDFSGSSARSYGSLSGAAAGYGAYNSGSRHNGKMGRGFGGGGGGYGPYGAYNNYGGNYGGGYAGFYGGYGGNYGGYGYGFGYGGPMYGNAGYPASGYGMPAGYGGNTAYAGSKGYGSGAAGRGGSRGGGSYGSSGGYDRSDGYDRSGGSSTGRYHPYQK